MRQKLKWHNKSKHYLENFPSILYVERKFLSAQYRKEFTNDIHYELPNYSNRWSIILRSIIKKERNFRVLKPQRAHYVIVLRSMNYRFSTSSLICVQINNDLFAVGTGLRISNTFQFLLMDWSYVIVFPRQNDWTSKCHYKASNLTVNQCLILSVCVFKEFECKVKTFVDSL